MFKEGTARAPRPLRLSILIGAVLLLLQVFPAQAQPVNFILDWGGFASWPRGITADEVRVYVVVQHLGKVKTFDGSGHLVVEWGAPGVGPTQFNNPRGIEIGSDGMLYVADTFNSRVQKIAPNGMFQSLFTAAGMDRPWDVALDGEGNLYVVDTDSPAVFKFDPAGVLLTSWGSPGSGDGQFDQPRGIAVDSEGEVFVADTFNDRVQRFDSEGGFVLSWPTADNPEGIEIDSSGNVYVGALDAGLMQKFNISGGITVQWTAPPPSPFRPLDVAVARDGRLFVVDTDNFRVIRFGDEAASALFADGFESGDTSRWTDTVP